MPNSTTLQHGWVSASRAALRRRRSGGRAATTSSTTSQHLALHASRRAADGRDDGRDARQDDRLRRRDQERSIPARWSSGPRSGAGAATSSAATTSSTARTHGWSFSARSRGARRHGLPAVAAAAAAAATPQIGQRLLDVFTVHYYPQGGEFSDDTSSSAMQLRRNRSTRSLWDPSLRRRDAGSTTRCSCIPRLRDWVNTYLPGHADRHHRIQLGRGKPHQRRHHAGRHLGIFGREGLDLAARWTTPDRATPTYKAMKMYRNYDGRTFDVRRHQRRGDVAANPDNAVGLRRAAVERRRADASWSITKVCPGRRP